MISCRHVSKRFGNFAAVDHVSFHIPTGSICGLIGPNGAGKTTTLRILTGILDPSEGGATVAGIPVTEKPPRLKQAIGFMPDSLGLFDALTVEEHLELTGAVYRIGKESTRTRTDQLLALLALDDSRRLFAEHCSHGMRKKIAFAMATLHNPRVLFLDEPFEGMDPVGSSTVQRELAAAAQRGVTIMFTSHSLPLVERFATHIVFMSGGRVVLDSSASSLEGSLEARYFEAVGESGSGDMSWLGSRQS